MHQLQSWSCMYTYDMAGLCCGCGHLLGPQRCGRQQGPCSSPIDNAEHEQRHVAGGSRSCWPPTGAQKWVFPTQCGCLDHPSTVRHHAATRFYTHGRITSYTRVPLLRRGVTCCRAASSLYRSGYPAGQLAPLHTQRRCRSHQTGQRCFYDAGRRENRVTPQIRLQTLLRPGQLVANCMFIARHLAGLVSPPSSQAVTMMARPKNRLPVAPQSPLSQRNY